MKIWAISDLHLCTTDPEKKMDRFGENWIDHPTNIYNNWKSVVGDNDIVLIPGDICWALKFDNGLQELRYLQDLPGIKVFSKGNHDYWWKSIKNLRMNAPDRMYFINNDALTLDINGYRIGIGGTRLWHYDLISWPCVLRNEELDELAKDKEPVDPKWLAKMRKREIERLEFSLKQISDDTYKIAMVHYPPYAEDGRATPITKIMTKYNIRNCVFGHLHSVQGNPKTANWMIDKTSYHLVSSDYIDFTPKLVMRTEF